MTTDRICLTTLDNGAEVLLKEDHFSNTVAVQCWVRTGSLHETPQERGMAHVLEHMLFKGTERRGVGEIAKTVEHCGGNINAYTTFDRTVFYLTLDKKHTRLGIDLLADAIFFSSFDADEFAREKEVILEEIRRGNDDPGSVIGKKIFEMVYAGSEAGRPIIGSTESVSSFTRADLVNFHKTWYRPDNISVVVIGSFDADETLGWVRESFGLNRPRLEKSAELHITRPAMTSTRVAVLKGPWEEPRVEIAFPAPALLHAETPALDVAAFALGGSESSRLYRKLREQDGVVMSVSASLYVPSFEGVLEVSAVMAPDQVLPSIEALGAECEKARWFDPIREDELQRARVNMKADRAFQRETVEGQARSLGYGLTTLFKNHFDEIYWSWVKDLSPDEVQSALTSWVDPSKATVAVLVPEGTELTEESVLQAFTRGVSSQRSTKTEKRRRSAVVGAKHSIPERLEIRPGVEFIYRQHPNTELFALVGASEGGLRDETAATTGQYSAMASMLCRATKHHSYEQLQETIEGLGASISGFSGKDSFGVKLHILAEFAQKGIDLWAQCLLEPVFPEAQWLNQRKETLEDLRTQDDSPSGVCVRKFQEAVYWNHPYRRQVIGTKQSIENLTADDLLKSYARTRDDGPWVLSAVGPQSSREVLDMLETRLAHWHTKSAARTFRGMDEPQPKTPPTPSLFVKKDREQTHIIFGGRGLSWEDPLRPALDVAAMVLGGQGGRLFLNLRDRESLAYSVAPIMSFGCEPGIFATYIACAPDKSDRALELMRAELSKLQNELVSAEEIERAQNYIVGNHEQDMQRGDSQAMTMALMALFGVGHTDFLTYPKRIASVTSRDVQNVAKKIMSEKMNTICVGANAPKEFSDT